MNNNFKYKYITRQNKPDLHISIAEGEIAQKTSVLMSRIGWHGGFDYSLLNLLRDAGYRSIIVRIVVSVKSSRKRNKRWDRIEEKLVRLLSDKEQQN